MARPTTIPAAMQEGLGVLFDTNVLIRAAREGASGGPVTGSMISIHANRRFVTELVLWEFLCHGRIPGTTRDDRRRWLRRLAIELQPQPAGYHETLRALLKNSAARGSGVDAQLAAYVVSSRLGLAIASDNVRELLLAPPHPAPRGVR